MHQTRNDTPLQLPALYQLVFKNRTMRLFVVGLLVTIVVQPTFIVYAQEIDEGTVEAVPASASKTAEPLEASEPAVALEAEAESETDAVTVSTTPAKTKEIVTEEPTPEPPKEVVQPVPTISTASSSESNTPVVRTATTSTPVASSSSTTTQSAATTTTVTTATSSASTTTVDVNAGTDDTVSDDTVASTTADTMPLSVTTNNAGTYQFNRNHCVRVDDGSFYCDTAAPARPTADSFYVALDGDGDREIFMVRDGETVQITHNTYDDAAPHYDGESDSLVWHAQISGRYQIMSYDFASDEIEQLTDSRVNHMEPTRSGDYTVWQEWGANSWDIVLHSGGDKQNITNDDAPDIAPVVKDGLIIWKRIFSGEQVAVVYDIAAGEMLEIADDTAGSRVENARLMLVYESVDEAGDRTLLGYDRETHSVTPIAAVPTPVPDSIPDSEPTQEVRALVQNKSVHEEDEVTSGVATTTSSSSAAATAATSTRTALDNDFTLTISSSSSVTKQSTTTINAEPISDEFDLVIPPTTASSTS